MLAREAFREMLFPLSESFPSVKKNCTTGSTRRIL